MSDAADESRNDEDPHTFERSLAALEAVVARLEQGDVGLEEAVALFEQGRGHLEHCKERLALAQQRIQELTGTPESPAMPDPLERGDGDPDEAGA